MIGEAGVAALVYTDPVTAVAAVTLIIFVAWGLTYGLLRAAQKPHPTSMVTALSLLTLISLLGMVASEGETSNTFGTLAATGIGALAGAVASQYQLPQKPDKKDTEDDSPE